MDRVTNNVLQIQDSFCFKKLHKYIPFHARKLEDQTTFYSDSVKIRIEKGVIFSLGTIAGDVLSSDYVISDPYTKAMIQSYSLGQALSNDTKFTAVNPFLVYNIALCCSPSPNSDTFPNS